MKKLVLHILCTFCVLQMQGQADSGGWIVDVDNNRIDRFTREISVAMPYAAVRLLSPDLGIFLVATESDGPLEAYLANHPLVSAYGPDERVQPRGRVPSDALWSTQWHLEKTSVDEAWETTTGGRHLDGHDIVVAVLDEGFDVFHEDLFDNIYTNEEIPDDGIDNDNNGYIDDYYGVSLDNGADEHRTNILDSHGTAVAGIIGAVGDNEIGIPGVMWDVKVLPISGVRSISSVIEGYQYVADLRRKWNATNGAEGAYIVAANYSGGIDFANANDPQYVPWCEMYDLLGSVGVLSTCSTSNADTNVDTQGDMPTTCTSPYLIAVTNTREDDQKVRDAGYGQTHIDLAAPGGYANETGREDLSVNTLQEEDEYGPFIGTSASAPLVGGAIALLYTTACSDLQILSQKLPSEAALRVRSSLLSNVDEVSALNGLLATGGRLNVDKAVKYLEENCDDLEIGEDDILISQQNDGSYTLVLQNLPLGTYDIALSDAVGRQVWQRELMIDEIEDRLVELRLDNMATGIYYFSIYNDMLIRTKPVVLSH